MTMLKYAIYVRKSSENEDRQVQSIDDQLHHMRQIAAKRNLNIVHTFTESKSAKVPFNRPEFQKLIKMIETGKIDGIITWQINRLSRNPAESGQLMQLLQDGLLKQIVTNDRDYLPEDNVLLFNVEAGIANQFIIDLRKNVKRGIDAKLRSGGISGVAPEGYRNNREDRTIEPDPERFPLVKKAFSMFLTGDYTVTEIKAAMDSWGYATIKRRKRGGKPITRTALYHMLSNPRYYGVIPNPDNPAEPYKAKHQAMITEDEFFEIQRLLGRRGKPRYVSKRHFELRGLLRCGECGAAITAEKHAKKLKNGSTNYHTYYHCTKKRPCSQKGVKEAELFVEVGALLSRYTISDELYQWGIKAIKEIAKKELSDRDAVQNMLFDSQKQIQTKLDRLLELVTDGVIDNEDYKRQSVKLKQDLQKRIEEQSDHNNRIKNWYEIVGNTLELLANCENRFNEADFNLRKQILDAIGYNPVLIDKKLAIEVHPWIVPIENYLDEQNTDAEKVRTNTQQIKKAPNGADLSIWYRRPDLNRHVPKDTRF